MLGSVVTALLLASSVSHVAAGPLESRHKHIARGYRQDAAILEDYTPYHVRYLALNCQGQHNTTFFDKCCHPLLRWQKLSDRPKECIPSPSASSAAAAAEPTSPPIDEDPIDDDCEPEEDPEDDCEDETTTAPAATLAPVTTSTKAPEPTSTKAPHSEPPVTSAEPTTTQRPSTTRMVTSTVRTSSAEPTTSAAPDNGNTGGDLITGGQATWFKQNGGTGACGQVHGENDYIVAMDYRMYGDENSRSKYCGKSVLITNKNNGKQAKAIVADCCPTCATKGSLDMSLGLFQGLGEPLGAGVFPIEYTILN